MNTLNRMEPCYDCGSTIENHHTAKCELAPEECERDLDSIPGTQWWTDAKETPHMQWFLTHK